MKKTKAMLLGGPNDGQTWELDEAHKEIEIAHRVLERNGQWRVVFTAKYKLESTEPLKYQFSD